jgi:hypothetical protein
MRKMKRIGEKPIAHKLTQKNIKEKKTILDATPIRTPVKNAKLGTEHIFNIFLKTSLITQLEEENNRVLDIVPMRVSKINSEPAVEHPLNVFLENFMAQQLEEENNRILDTIPEKNSKKLLKTIIKPDVLVIPKLFSEEAENNRVLDVVVTSALTTTEEPNLRFLAE